MKHIYSRHKQIIAFTIATLFTITSSAQLATGDNNPDNKFLGNIVGSYIPGNFHGFWNQVTPENASKWGSVESTRDDMNWEPLDNIYNYAKAKNIPFKLHTFIWGSQEPSWIGGLSESEQLAEVEEWIELAADRYPDTEMIDVVNEALESHAPASYRNTLTNAYRAAHPTETETEWDWVLWSFEKARAEFPNAILLINDYSIITSTNNIADYLEMIAVLQNKGLIDAIGIQAHGFSWMTGTQITDNLNLLAAAGLPIYVTELDITDLPFNGDTRSQLQRYQDLFPSFWEHDAVVAVTLWGYVEGETWLETSGLVSNTGVKNDAMLWLEEYLQYEDTTEIGENNITIRARGVDGTEEIQILEDFVSLGSFTLTTSMEDYSVFGVGDGIITLNYSNDIEGRDVVVDYAIINDVKYEAEDQKVNTGAWNNETSSCGSEYNENLHCSGYIEFDASVVLGINDVSIQSFKMYPNPSNGGEIDINFSSRENGNVKIYDLNGKMLLENIFNDQQNVPLNFSLTSGLYFVNVTTNDKSVTKKLIVR